MRWSHLTGVAENDTQNDKTIESIVVQIIIITMESKYYYSATICRLIPICFHSIPFGVDDSDFHYTMCYSVAVWEWMFCFIIFRCKITHFHKIIVDNWIRFSNNLIEHCRMTGRKKRMGNSDENGCSFKCVCLRVHTLCRVFEMSRRISEVAFWIINGKVDFCVCFFEKPQIYRKKGWHEETSERAKTKSYTIAERYGIGSKNMRNGFLWAMPGK